ncbi:MAG: glycosyltransferase family 2 protein, partial [Candidatus Omnitrophica bacterium]|nr:glycosyltransferase family 2 protein [Candidatus Omnitrophota bacterium]
MKLSVLMPAHNEEENIKATINELYGVLVKNNIDNEILVVNDNSTDSTDGILGGLKKEIPTLRVITNNSFNGYGFAVRLGLQHIEGDAVCVMMADGSDFPDDAVKYFKKLHEGYDCVFGSRFIKGSKLIDYPLHKLVLNRLGNWFIKLMLRVPHNDITNGFKCYKKEVIKDIEPLFSNHFNLTVEMPLKAIMRGYSFATIPIKWANRAHGISKFRIKEMGSRYLFIIFYIFLEKHLSRGDYLR